MAELLDLTVIQESCGNNATVITAALRLFVRTTEADLARLDAAVGLRDALAVQHLAHRMKGAARALASPAIAETAQEIETASGASDWSKIDRALPGLSDTLHQLRDHIGARLPAEPQG